MVVLLLAFCDRFVSRLRRLSCERHISLLEGDVTALRVQQVELQENIAEKEQQRVLEVERVTQEIARLEDRAVQAERTVSTAIKAVTSISGVLEKRGQTWKSWRQRQCVLEGQSLRYYLKPTDTSPRGVISLISPTDVVFVNDGSSREFQVRLRSFQRFLQQLIYVFV